MALACTTSRLRVEEKLLFQELEDRGAAFERVDDAGLRLDLTERDVGTPWSAVWNRSVAFGRTLDATEALCATEALEARGVACFNNAHVTRTCGDKALTSLALAAVGVPMLWTEVCLTSELALQAAGRFGYPCVLEPVVGSWGRLVAGRYVRCAGAGS